jgi:hypothetical protein
MPVSNTIEVAGVKDALRELNDIDKKLRRQITKDYNVIVQPIVADGKSQVPKEAPLSGFNRSWTPPGATEPVLPFGNMSAPREPRGPGVNYMQTRTGRRRYVNWINWQNGMKAYISGKKPRTFNGYTKNLATFGIRWQGPAAVLFDTSNTPSTDQGRQMVAALNAKYGKPSRVMWRAYERQDEKVQREMRKLVNDIMEAVDRKTRI